MLFRSQIGASNGQASKGLGIKRQGHQKADGGQESKFLRHRSNRQRTLSWQAQPQEGDHKVSGRVYIRGFTKFGIKVL